MKEFKSIGFVFMALASLLIIWGIIGSLEYLNGPTDLAKTVQAMTERTFFGISGTVWYILSWGIAPLIGAMSWLTPPGKSIAAKLLFPFFWLFIFFYFWIQTGIYIGPIPLYLRPLMLSVAIGHIIYVLGLRMRPIESTNPIRG